MEKLKFQMLMTVPEQYDRLKADKQQDDEAFAIERNGTTTQVAKAQLEAAKKIKEKNKADLTAQQKAAKKAKDKKKADAKAQQQAAKKVKEKKKADAKAQQEAAKKVKEKKAAAHAQ
ncbi:hypothetical protein MYU51_018323 [Penicillium brevicompactum]